MSAQTVGAAALVEIAISEPGDLIRLQAGGFDLLHATRGEMVQALIWDEDERAELLRLGFRFITVHQNFEDFLARRLQPGRDDMGGYRTLSEIEDDIFALHEDYPEVVGEPISIGETIEDRSIWAVRISDNPDEDEDEPEVLFTSLIHAREVITQELLISVMTLFAEEYGNDEYLTDLVDNRQMWFIPCHNPDGYAYNEAYRPNGGGMWRKNRRRNHDGAIGVDLNRNFGHEWGYDNIGSSANPDDQTYRGEAAFSEPETQAAREFVNDRNIRVSIYFHSYSNLCLYPLGYDYIHAGDRPAFMAFAGKLTAGNSYIPGTGWETLYLTNGDSDDWLYMSDEHDPIWAMTFEIGTQQDNFWPPLNRVPTLVEENIPVCLLAAEFADAPERVLPPPSPMEVTVGVDVRNSPVLRWEAVDDEFNPAVSYNVLARMPADEYFDNIDPDDEHWDSFNVAYSQNDPHSEPFSYRFNEDASMAVLTLRREFIAPDTIFAWLKFLISRQNNLALEITADGYTWEALGGRDTRDVEVAGFNHGPGLRGDSRGWSRYWWSAGDYAGSQVKIRFRYYEFGRAGRDDHLFIDDVGPFPGAEWSEVVAEGTEELMWIDEDLSPDDGQEYFVQAIDGEGDVSFWSAPARIGGGALFPLPLAAGWSMVSMPARPIAPDLEDVFAELIERDAVGIVKDGFGNFFKPDFGFNNIGRWNPLRGYLIYMLASDTLFIDGERVAVHTPLPVAQGWNMIAYLPIDPHSVEEAFASIADNVEMAKDGFGRFWLPDLDFSNMVDLQFGQGYLVKLTEDDELIYPQDEGDGVAAAVLLTPPENGFTPPSAENHSLLIVSDSGFPAGEIILRDGDGMIAGAAQVNAGQKAVGIAAWGESAPNSAGYSAGEPFAAEFTAGNLLETQPIEMALLRGGEGYSLNGFTLFAGRLAASPPPAAVLVGAHPNPFNARSAITFNLETAAIVNLSIYDAGGRLVESLVSGGREAGVHTAVWDARGAASGLYIAELRADGDGGANVRRQRLLLVR